MGSAASWMFPLEDATAAQCEEEARKSSHAGFLGVGETVASVVGADAERLSALGDTSCAQGQFVRRLLRAAEATGRPSGSVPVKDGPGREEEGALVEFERIDALGDQWSPFPDEEHVRWRCEYVLRRRTCVEMGAHALDDGGGVDDGDGGTRRRRLDVEVRVGGHADAGVARWIQERGFYEGGGMANPYRVDPRAVHALRTGRIAASWLCDRRAYFDAVVAPRLEQDVADAEADVRRLPESEREAYGDYILSARRRLRQAIDDYT